MNDSNATTGVATDAAGLKVAYAQLQGPNALRALRVSDIEKVRLVTEEELEAAWAGKKAPKQALDDAVQRGNLILAAKPEAQTKGKAQTPKK